jgi:aubergine-like protein
MNRDSNLRSIINKVLIQINAKMGGIPWSIRNLPFFDEIDVPTTVIGYDIVNKRGKKSVVGLCASINKEGNRFFSRAKEQTGNNITENL